MEGSAALLLAGVLSLAGQVTDPVNFDRREAHEGFDSPVRLSDEALDDGQIREKISTSFSTATVVAVLVLGEIDGKGVEYPEEVVAEVLQVHVIKGKKEEVIDSLPLDVKHVAYLWRRKEGDPIESPWASADVGANRHFVVFSNMALASLAEHLQMPTSVRPFAEDSMDEVLRELRFLNEFTAQPMVEQLSLTGLGDYLDSGGVIGLELGHYLGKIYGEQPLSLRPKILPVIESLRPEAFRPVGLRLFGYHDSNSWPRLDSVGASILSVLKGMSSFDGSELGEEAVSAASSYYNFDKFLKRHEDIAKEFVLRQDTVDQIERLKAVSKKWNIRTSGGEEVLTRVLEWIKILEELRN